MHIFQIYLLQSSTNILEQSKGIKQNWTGAKDIDNCICLIFDHFYKSFVSVRKTGL